MASSKQSPATTRPRAKLDIKVTRVDGTVEEYPGAFEEEITEGSPWLQIPSFRDFLEKQIQKLEEKQKGGKGEHGGGKE